MEPSLNRFVGGATLLVFAVGCGNAPRMETIQTGDALPLSIGTLEKAQDVPAQLQPKNEGPDRIFGPGDYLYFELPESAPRPRGEDIDLASTRLPGGKWNPALSVYVSKKGRAVLLPRDLESTDAIDVKMEWPGSKPTVVRVHHPPTAPANPLPITSLSGQVVALDQGEQWTFVFRPRARQASEAEVVRLSGIQISSGHGKPEGNASTVIPVGEALYVSRLNTGGTDALIYRVQTDHFRVQKESTGTLGALARQRPLPLDQLLQHWDATAHRWVDFDSARLSAHTADHPVRYRILQVTQSFQNEGRIPLTKETWPESVIRVNRPRASVFGQLKPEKADRLLGPALL
ncbi:hypothetical protein EON79_10775 [bacterium]|nr:MAG: hypothetical protein EON79_10775 [bacterium]